MGMTAVRSLHWVMTVTGSIDCKLLHFILVPPLHESMQQVAKQFTCMRRLRWKRPLSEFWTTHYFRGCRVETFKGIIALKLVCRPGDRGWQLRLLVTL